jgi:microcystin-dependent protein
MPYNVNFTDKTTTPITVYDNVTDESTDLKFPGRNVTGYGQIIAENFLHLLENFAGANKPPNSVEGQLWYDTTNGTLMINDGTGDNGWKAAGNIQKSPTAPNISEDKVGEIWVDTIKQQLYVWSGKTWVLVGPQFSTENGLRTGTVVETINDTDGIPRNVIKFLSDEIPVAIISKDTFIPKININGFTIIKTGMNINSTGIGNSLAIAKLYGTAQSSDALTIAGIEIASSKFLRSDVVNTTEYGLNIRNNSGIALGVDGTFRLTTSITSSSIYNATPGSSIDLQVNAEGSASTTLRVIGNKVGINVLSPQVALDIDGNIAVTGNIRISGTDQTTSFTTGSFATQGGVAIAKNLLVGTNLEAGGTTTLRSVVPKSTTLYDLGASTLKWNNIYAETINAGYLKGVLDGDVAGNARTATNLREKTTFQLTGQVESNVIQFDGSFEGRTKIFDTRLTANIIDSQIEPTPNTSTPDDQVLVYRPGTGLLKESRDVFVADLGVPIGAIMPFAGLNVPSGYLLCDGSEQEKVKYQDLFDVIGNSYGVPSRGVNTFKIPDLRGRFPLGRDSMDNGTEVPNAGGGGGFVDAGGGGIGRIPGTDGTTLGGSAGAATNSLEVRNLPQHEHSLTPIDQPTKQYTVVRLDSTTVPGTSPGTGPGPTSVGQAQYLNTTGGIKTTATLGSEFSILNPYLTINYIIRSGPPAF